MDIANLEKYNADGMCLYYIYNQYKLLEENRKALRGLYILPKKEDIFEWDALLFIYGGYFSDTIYNFGVKFNNNISSTSDIPKIWFKTKTFHPLIDAETGQVDLSGLLKLKANPQVFEILYYIFQSFYSVPADTLTPFNKEAYILYTYGIMFRFHNKDRQSELLNVCSKLSTEIRKKFKISDKSSPFYINGDLGKDYLNFKTSLLNGDFL